jgi:hypothetical protein
VSKYFVVEVSKFKIFKVLRIFSKSDNFEAKGQHFKFE